MVNKSGRVHYRVKRKEICNRYDTDSHIFIDEAFADYINDTIHKNSSLIAVLSVAIIIMIIAVSLLFAKYVGTISAQTESINDIAVEFKANEFKTGGN